MTWLEGVMGGPSLCFARGSGEEWMALQPPPVRNAGFREQALVRFATRDPGPWTLYIDDEPLQGNPQEGVTQWTWRPGFFAGPVVAELARGGAEPPFPFFLEIEPDPAKTSASTFDEMVATIRKEAPELLLGAEPATANFGVLDFCDDPWIAFARLRQHGRGFTRSLRAIGADPIRAVRRIRRIVPAHQVRRVDLTTLRSIARRPDLVSFFAGHGARPVSAGIAPARGLDVPHIDETFDTAGNRCLAALVDTVVARIRSVRERLAELAAQESAGDAVTSIAPRWPRRRDFLDALEAALIAIRRTSPLRDVSRPEVSAAGLTAIVAHPLYQRAYRLGWTVLRTGLDGPVEDDRSWMGPSWQIFERWCFVRLAAELRSSHPRMGWSRRVGASKFLACWTGLDGDRRLELYLQPAFPGIDAQERTWFASISKYRCPDIVLVESSPAGRRFVVLDAKYRTTRANVLDAMESAHIYHDSLRLDGRRSDAVLLVIPAGGGAPRLETEEFLAEHGVGVWATHPWNAVEILKRLFARRG